MRKTLLVLMVSLLITACGPAAPNPHAEGVLLALADSINTKDYEAIRAHFLPDASFQIEDISWSMETVDMFIDMIKTWGPYYEFTDFVITGDEVEFQWFIKEPATEVSCLGKVTMEGEKITYLERSGCDYGK